MQWKSQNRRTVDRPTVCSATFQWKATVFGRYLIYEWSDYGLVQLYAAEAKHMGLKKCGNDLIFFLFLTMIHDTALFFLLFNFKVKIFQILGHFKSVKTIQH